jgi:ABC-type Fe3+ transport system permease subunit
MRQRFVSAALAAGLAFLLAFLVSPIAYIFYYIYTQLAAVAPLLASPYYFDVSPAAFQNAFQIERAGSVYRLVLNGPDMGVIANSLWVGLTVALADTLLGLAIAFALAKYEFRGRTALGIVATAPLIVVPFVTAYVIRIFLNPLWGTLNWAISSLGIPLRVEIRGLAAVALAQMFLYLPIAYLNIYTAISRVDPTLEEVANNLGASGSRAARDIVLRLATPGIAAAFTLVFIMSIDDIAAPIIFQDYPEARKLMSYQIYQYFISSISGQISPATALLALILLAVSLAAFLAVRRYVGLSQYAMLVRQLRPRSYRPGPGGYALIALSFLVVIAAAAPLAGALVLVFADRWASSPLPSGLSPSLGLDRLETVLTNPYYVRGIENTVVYSLTATAAVVVMGILISVAAARFRGRAAGVLDALATAPIAIPGLVVAYSYFLALLPLSGWLAGCCPDIAHIINPLDNPATAIVIGYSVRKLPFAVRSMYAGLQQLHISTEEVSLNLGASYGRTLASVVLPLIRNNVISGALIAFVYMTSEVSLGVTLGSLKGLGYDHAMPITAVMSVDIQGSVNGLFYAAALGLILALIQIAAILLVTRVLKTRYGFIV